MKKYFLILITIAVSTTSYSMNESFWGSSSQVNNFDTQKIKNIKYKRASLESELQVGGLTKFQKKYVMPDTLMLFSSSLIDSCPQEFLKYIYYEEFHKTEYLFNLELLSKDPNLLKKCLIAQIDGYSALGAAIIASTKKPSPSQLDDSIQRKRFLIKNLMKIGFKPTSKDKELAYLELYERTPEDSECKLQLAFLSKTYHPSELPKLPIEIVRHIASYVTKNSLMEEALS